RRPPLPGRRGGRQDTGYSTASSPRGSLIDSPRGHKSRTPITDMEDRPKKRMSSSKATMTNR
ncbi:unnamed protein product, partial [Timema podura]|nr:unnamed protein product [Timema podura]